MKTNMLILLAAAAAVAAVFAFLPARKLDATPVRTTRYKTLIEILRDRTTPEKEAALKIVLEHYDEIKYGPFEQADALAAKFKPDDEKHNKNIRRRIVSAVGRAALVPMLKLLERGKPYEKINALVVLGHLDEPLSYPAIVSAASDPDPLVRLKALKIISRRKSTAAYPPFTTGSKTKTPGSAAPPSRHSRKSSAAASYPTAAT